MSATAIPTDLLPSPHIRRQRRIEKAVIGGLVAIASTGVLVTTGIVASLVGPSWQFFTARSISGYGQEAVDVSGSDPYAIPADDNPYAIPTDDNPYAIPTEDTGEEFVLRDSSSLDFADESLIQYEDPVSVREFFTSTKWYPQYGDADFGVLPLLVGTFLIMLVASVVAVPMGIGTAFFLSQYASERTRRMLKPVLELLAGVPTVVFGFFALLVIGPHVAARIWPFSDVGIYSGLSAGITVGLMILPMMATLADDAMAAVPRSLVEGAVALGATKREVSTQVVLPAALSGIMAAVIIALSRAIGETTIVLLAAGSQAVWTFNLGSEMQTMASYIGFAGIGDQPTDSKGYQTIFAVGLLLFLVTFALNVASRKVVARFREVYE